MSASELVERLRGELEREASCRQRQEELNSKLHQEYDSLLKRLAEAELHIDQMRVGEGRGTHRLSGDADQLRGRLDPSPRTRPGPDSTMLLHSKNPYQQNGIGTHNKLIYPQRNTGVNTEQDAATNGENSPGLSTPHVSTDSRVSLSSLEHSGETNGLESQASLVNSTGTDISEMSASSIANRASAESIQMAHLFRIHNLQEEISALKDKINSGGVSVGEVMASLEKIQEDHQQLAQDIAGSSAQLDALSQKYRGKAAAQIARSQEAIGSELVSLAEQLRELEELLTARASELFHSPPPTLPTSPTHRGSIVLPSVSTTESAMAFGRRQEGKTPSSPDDHLSDDSLNSPFVPDKYFTESTLHMHTHPNTPPLHASTEDYAHIGSYAHSIDHSHAGSRIHSIGHSHTGSYTHSNGHSHAGSRTHSNGHSHTRSYTHSISHSHAGSHTHSRSPTPSLSGSCISKDGTQSLSNSHPLDLSEREELSQLSSEEGGPLEEEMHSASSDWSSSLLSDQLKSPPNRTDQPLQQHSSSQTAPNGGVSPSQEARSHLRDAPTEVDRNLLATQLQDGGTASANLTPGSVTLLPPTPGSVTLLPPTPGSVTLLPPTHPTPGSVTLLPPTHPNSRTLQSSAQPHFPKSTVTPSPSPTPPSILHSGSRNRHTLSPPHLHHSHTSQLNPTHFPRSDHTHFLPQSSPLDSTHTPSSLSSPTFPASSRQSPMGQLRPPSDLTTQPRPPSDLTTQSRPLSDPTTQPHPLSDPTTLRGVESSFASSEGGRGVQYQGGRDRHPSLTTAALDALRGELRDLREQILTSIQHRTPPHRPTHQPVTPLPSHHHSHTSPLKWAGSSDQGVRNTVTTASQTQHQMHLKFENTASQTEHGAFSDGCTVEHKRDVVFSAGHSVPVRVRPSTHGRSTETSPLLNDRSTQVFSAGHSVPVRVRPSTHVRSTETSPLLNDRSTQVFSAGHSVPVRVRPSTHGRSTETSPLLNDRSTQVWEHSSRCSSPDTHTSPPLHSDLPSRSSRFLSPTHTTSGTYTHRNKRSTPLHVSILEPKHGNGTPHHFSTSEAESSSSSVSIPSGVDLNQWVCLKCNSSSVSIPSGVDLNQWVCLKCNSSSVSIPSGVDLNQWVCLKCNSRTTKVSPGTQKQKQKHKHKHKHKHRKRGDKGTQVSMTYPLSPPRLRVRENRTISDSADPTAHTIRAYRFSQRTSRGVFHNSSESSGSESEVRAHSEHRSSYKRLSEVQAAAAVQSHTPRDKLSESRCHYPTQPVATSTPAHSNRHSYWKERDWPKSSVTEPRTRYGHRDASTVGAESYSRPQHTYRAGATSTAHPGITLGPTSPPLSERSRSHSPLGHYHSRPARTQRTENRDPSLRLYTPHSRGDARFSRVSPAPGEELCFSEPGESPVRRGRELESRPCSVEGFYVVDGSGIYRSGTQIQVANVPVPDLSEVCRMARELRRCSMRLQGTLDSELSRRSSGREFY